MTTSFNSIAAEDFGFMLSEFGESRTRTPATGDPETVVGIWEPEPPEVNRETGKTLVWRGKLSIESTVTVLENDTWTIDGTVYQCVHIGKNDGGMRVIHLATEKREYTNKGTGVLR